MSKSVRHLFADMTAVIEDLHGVAVEGQAANLSPDIQLALTRNLRAGISRLNEIAASIALALGGAKL